MANMIQNLAPARCAALAALLLASGAARAQAAPAPAAAPQLTAGDARQGTFKIVQGDVTRVHEGQSLAAAVGDGLWAGDRVNSGAQSAAAITLRDGTVVSIGAHSSVTLSQFDFESTTREGHVLIALARGSLRLVTGLIAKLRPEQVRVTTPTTVIGVRGTDFIVEQNP